MSSRTDTTILSLIVPMAPTSGSPCQRSHAVNDVPYSDAGRARQTNDLRTSAARDAGPASTGAAPRASPEPLAVRLPPASSQDALAEDVARDGRERAAVLSRFLPACATGAFDAVGPRGNRRGGPLICRTS